MVVTVPWQYVDDSTTANSTDNTSSNYTTLYYYNTPTHEKRAEGCEEAFPQLHSWGVVEEVRPSGSKYETHQKTKTI